MAYNAYTNNYGTMYKIGDKYYYSEVLDKTKGYFKSGSTYVGILQDSVTSKFIVEMAWGFIEEIITVALGFHAYKTYGYSEMIVKKAPEFYSSTYVRSIGQEEYFTDYLTKLSRWVIKYGDSSEYTFQPVYINDKNYINMNDVGAVMGFSFSMEKDDTRKIQLIKVEKL